MIPMFLILGFLLTAWPALAEDTHRIKLADNVAIETALSPGEIIFNFFLFPFAYGYSLPHYGFSHYPYDSPDGYGRGDRQMAFAVEGSVQSTEGGRSAYHTLLRVRGGNRLGWDFATSTYSRGFFHPRRTGGLFTGHLTANYLQSKTALLEFGLGVGSFQNPSPRWGPTAELALDIFPAPPWTFSARWQACLLKRKGYATLSARVGAAWRCLGLGLGYRVFLNPFRDVSGPELSLQAWF